MRKILLDCDPGVDDTMAIMYSVLHPEIDLVAVGTVWGNVDVATATRNALAVLEMVGAPGVPVAPGAARPLCGGEPSFAHHVHGHDGQGNVGADSSPRVGLRAPSATSAAQQIVDAARADPGAISLAALGPLTNIAAALTLEPDLPDLVAGIFVMGGAALAPGNISPVAEANIGHDPEAAAAVFRARWPITMVGLDATMTVLITPERRAVLDAGGPAARYLSRALQLYGEFCARTAFGTWNATMHDTLAVAAAAGTLTIRRAPTVAVEVDTTNGPSRGATICDMRGAYLGYPAQDGAHCRVVLDVDDAIADEAVALIADYDGTSG